MSLNVNRNVEDVFYRYKMPKLVAKVEGKGNGIKTVIVNMTDIAKALGRPPTYPTKYFGCELGAQTQIDGKNERYIVNGEHDANKLQDILDGFIKKFVLCQNCENPETILAVKELTKKTHEIRQSCRACGFSTTLDQKHRLAVFIVKNPPPEDEKTEKAMKAQAQKGKAGVEADGEGEELGMGGLNGEEDHINGDAPNGIPEGDDWVDGSDKVDGVAPEAMTEAMKALVVDPDADLPLDQRLDKFHTFVKDRLEQAGSAAAIDAKPVITEMNRLDLDQEKATLILARALFKPENATSVAKEARSLFLRFTHQNPKSQRYLLGAMEQLVVGEARAKLLAKVPIIFQSLYEADVVEEEAFLDWARKGSKKFVSRDENKEVQAKAEPFIKWLQEAEEESDEDEDDDDDVEFEKETPPPPPAKTAVLKTNGATPAAAAKVAEDDDDDLDIDDI